MGLVAEAQRRKVFKVAAAYLVVGWLAIQVAATAFPQFDLPPRALRMLILAGGARLPDGAGAWPGCSRSRREGLQGRRAARGNKRFAGVAAALVALALGWYFHGQPGVPPAADGAAARSAAGDAPAIPRSRCCRSST